MTSPSQNLPHRAKSAADEGRLLMAHVLPFGVFMGLLAVSQLVPELPFANDSLFFVHPEFFIYPLQTVVVGFLLWKYRDCYRLRSLRKPLLSLGIGVLVLLIWISPQLFFGAERRTEGFQPNLLEDSPGWVLFQYFFRFLRLVVVVPLMEELFWRGFLMRYMISTRFSTIAVGRSTPMAFLITVVLFGLAHAGPDLPAALLTGVLYNWLLIRSRSISDCVLAHGLTNLLLGIYIVSTGQWGFW